MNRITCTSVVDTCIAAGHNSYGQREVPAWGRNETGAAARELLFVLVFNSNIRVLLHTATQSSAENPF
jgi:hypothetical protein